MYKNKPVYLQLEFQTLVYFLRRFTRKSSVLLAIIFCFQFCQQSFGREELDPNIPIGMTLHLLPFLLPVPTESNTKEFHYFYVPNSVSYGVIAGLNVNVTTPFGTNRSALMPHFLHSGKDISKNGVTQISGETKNDFTSTNAYLITAENQSTKTYQVTITNGLSTSKALTNFQFDTLVTRGVFIGTTFVMNVPYGSDLSNLSQ